MLVSVVQQSEQLYVCIYPLFFKFLFIQFWLCWVIVAARGLLTAGASLVSEHGLRGAQAQ